MCTMRFTELKLRCYQASSSVQRSVSLLRPYCPSPFSKPSKQHVSLLHDLSSSGFRWKINSLQRFLRLSCANIDDLRKFLHFKDVNLITSAELQHLDQVDVLESTVLPTAWGECLLYHIYRYVSRCTAQRLLSTYVLHHPLTSFSRKISSAKFLKRFNYCLQEITIGKMASLKYKTLI